MAAAKSSTKSVAKPPAVATPVAKPVAVAPAKAAAKPAVDPQVRLRMIAEAAYYLAEKRGFIHGHHDQDWAQAEREIDALLGAR